MTRIISGRAGSLTLAVPDSGTRPTSDRVRESLFGALDAAGAIEGAAVLDLYAGSGALGLEAASRGAASVDLVEKASRAASVARRNAAQVGRAVDGTPIRVHATAALAFAQGTMASFDLVFIDPPYDLPEGDLTALLHALVPRLTADAIVIVERGARSPRPDLPTGLEHLRDRRYGDTLVWWVQPAAEPPSR